jgi:hypothetical protein
VFNQAFKPNHHAPKLRRDEPVSCYVSKGDKVYIKVYRNSAGKEFEWSAWDAWMEDTNASEPSTRSEDPVSRITKQQHKGTRKAKEKKLIMKGRLSFIAAETAHLESTDCSGTVFFHRDSAFLFGVPMEGLRLDHIFRIGMVVVYFTVNTIIGTDNHCFTCTTCFFLKGHHQVEELLQSPSSSHLLSLPTLASVYTLGVRLMGVLSL